MNEQQFIQTSGIVFNPVHDDAALGQHLGQRNRKKCSNFLLHRSQFSRGKRHGRRRSASTGRSRRSITGNVTYVYSQGVHQFFTDNLSAAAEFPLANAQSDTYPATAPAAPSTNNLQYQSGGFYREHQIMATLRATYRKFSLVCQLHLFERAWETRAA